jgi:hypothetical protein
MAAAVEFLGRPMNGTLWVTSYAVLSLAVLWLVLAVLALYRRASLGQPSRAGWPSVALIPGERLPRCAGRTAGNKHRVVLGDDIEDAIVVFVVADDHTGYAAVMSAAVLAERNAMDLRVGIYTAPFQDLPQWVSDLDQDILDATVILSSPEFDGLGLNQTPVLAAVRGGRLRHAVAGIATPTDARQHLQVFLEGRQHPGSMGERMTRV